MDKDIRPKDFTVKNKKHLPGPTLEKWEMVIEVFPGPRLDEAPLYVLGEHLLHTPLLLLEFISNSTVCLMCVSLAKV